MVVNLLDETSVCVCVCSFCLFVCLFVCLFLLGGGAFQIGLAGETEAMFAACCLSNVGIRRNVPNNGKPPSPL